MDEAGQASEPECLIPLGLISDINGQVRSVSCVCFCLTVFPRWQSQPSSERTRTREGLGGQCCAVHHSVNPLWLGRKALLAIIYLLQTEAKSRCRYWDSMADSSAEVSSVGIPHGRGEGTGPHALLRADCHSITFFRGSSLRPPVPPALCISGRSPSYLLSATWDSDMDYHFRTCFFQFPQL